MDNNTLSSLIKVVNLKLQYTGAPKEELQNPAGDLMITWEKAEEKEEGEKEEDEKKKKKKKNCLLYTSRCV